MNIVDVLAILPYYVELVMEQESKRVKDAGMMGQNFTLFNLTVLESNDYSEQEEEEEEDDNFQGLLQVFRVFKLARILKLARYISLKQFA